MRKIVNINKDWKFIDKNIDITLTSKAKYEDVNIPHTWNGIDGQDGGNDYVREKYWYLKSFTKPKIKSNQQIFVEFNGVNSSASIYLNHKLVGYHDGGYSTFRFPITKLLNEDMNEFQILVDNTKRNDVYPQKADFTFYGGIYRDVNLIIVEDTHFDLMHNGNQGVKIETFIENQRAYVNLAPEIIGKASFVAKVIDHTGKVVLEENNKYQLMLENFTLWDGFNNPYLYTIEISLINEKAKVVDQISKKIGFRSFHIDPNQGFYLNGKKYPLRGVCRHQDRPQIGNALTHKEHLDDIELIKEVGANTIRLAHYQHDQYFYDLCDQMGFIVWAEIPYISQHLKDGDQNAKSQMEELIYQNIHHPSIVTWGISNEVTISHVNKKCIKLHEDLHELCHKLDNHRLTVIADYMPTRINHKLNSIPDIVSYNLYFGWYLPFTKLSGWKLDRYHRRFPNRIVGLSEYGAEGMPNIHSAKPRRGDNTEEYQNIYHEQMLEVINKRDYIWATHLWNMFDFAADARNQGGEPGMNHKGLVTFDRKTKKDSFYLYKAYWSNDPFVHIAGKRFEARNEETTEIKIYTNLKFIKVYHNSNIVYDGPVDKIARIKVKLSLNNDINVVSGKFEDKAMFYKVKHKPNEYKIKKQSNKSWEK